MAFHGKMPTHGPVKMGIRKSWTFGTRIREEMLVQKTSLWTPRVQSYFACMRQSKWGSAEFDFWHTRIPEKNVAGRAVVNDAACLRRRYPCGACREPQKVENIVKARFGGRVPTLGQQASLTDVMIRSEATSAIGDACFPIFPSTCRHV